VKTELEKLTQVLKYDFEDPSLLRLALSHRSINGPNNERLEFLGDSILNFIIAEALFEKYPHEKEGKLSRMRANLVNGEVLAELAEEFKLADYILLGLGELRSGGASRKSIRADAVEAIIGAIFLDSNFETTRERVRQWFSDRLASANSQTHLKDPKTRLQEHVQKQQCPVPTYRVRKVEGKDHAQTFVVDCTIEGMEVEAQGTGANRRKAEQAAAAAVLKLLGEPVNE